MAMILGTAVTTGGVTAVLAKMVRSKSEKKTEPSKPKEN
jgi:hypothetical protein